VSRKIDSILVMDYPTADDARWTRRQAQIHKLIPGSVVTLRLRSPRPPTATPAVTQVLIGGQIVDMLEVTDDWQTYEVVVPERLRLGNAPITLTLETEPFRPRAYDRANGDNRALGIEVDWVATSNKPTVR
jgi:hypothetical protein